MDSPEGIWERGTMTVPEDTPDSRVQERAYKYKQRLGDALEAQGFTVHRILEPILSTSKLPTEEGRKRYDLWASISRKPITIVERDIPDELVPQMKALGLKEI